jgi:argonaute-like protein implicated in RNA metabolism and viral defense
MEPMFGFRMNDTSIGGVSTNSFEVVDLEYACETIEKNARGRPVVPVLITPFKKGGDEEASVSYYRAKHTLLKRGWPSQFVSLDTLNDRNVLKWSVSNIGLQLFAKMGGQPWKVLPETERCLIIGLGQSHKIVDGKVEKYIAYSVLTDSSGLYEELRVLGSSSEEASYLQNLRRNLSRILTDYGDQYDRFVIHATFKVQKRELDAVKQVLDSTFPGSDGPRRSREFAVLKFNDRNRFFGYSEASNSRIPYESTFLQLSRPEYLVWFEGLQWHRPNVYKRIERPLHVEFLYPEVKLIQDNQRVKYLQDAVNLSGANWRGFNAKSLPVSVYYAKIIADYFKEFQALGLDDIDLTAIHPWFL